MENKSKAFSITALVTGIIGVVGSFIPVVSYFSLALAVVGIVFGVKGRKTATDDSKGMATAGLVLGIIGAAFSAVGVLCVICAVGAASTLAAGSGLL